MDNIPRLRNLASNRNSPAGGQIGLNRSLLAKQHVDCPSCVSLSRDRAFTLIDREYGMREIDEPAARYARIKPGRFRLWRGMLVAAEVLRRSIEIGLKDPSQRPP